MRHTRSASIATIVVALGLALTTIGISRGLPHEVGGVGSRLTVAADTWAHGSAVSPPLVLLVTIGLLAAIAVRRGAAGRRSARLLAVVAATGLVAGLLEPVHQRSLIHFSADPVLALLVLANDVALVALVYAALGRIRADEAVARAVRHRRVGRGAAAAPSPVSVPSPA